MLGTPHRLGIAEGIDGQVAELIDDLDLSLVEDIAIEIPGWIGTTDVRETVRRFAFGESIAPETVLTDIAAAFSRQAAALGKLALYIVIPVMMSSFVSSTGMIGNVSNALGRKLGLIVVLVPVVLSVTGELEHVKDTITVTTERMNGILPILLTLLIAVGGNASSAFLHPVVIAASGSMVYLAREVILRLVMCTCAVTTVNHLSDRVRLTRLARLLKSAVCWLLGVSFTVFLGAMSVQGVCSASIDGIMIRAAKYAVDNFVPVVGGMFSDTMDTLVGCTLIVKNALGVTAMLVLSGAMLMPMVRTLAVAAVMKFCAALLEPVALPEVIAAIEDFSGMLVLFLITMLCVCTMYFLLIVQMLLVGNLTVMLR